MSIKVYRKYHYICWTCNHQWSSSTSYNSCPSCGSLSIDYDDDGEVEEVDEMKEGDKEWKPDGKPHR